MVEGGEDPRFIARRMSVLASEDIGNADPQALQVAVAAAHAVEHVGMPECALNLSQAAVYLSLAPKSHASCQAIARARADTRDLARAQKSNATSQATARARADIREHGAESPPAHLQDSHYPGAKKLGRGA